MWQGEPLPEGGKANGGFGVGRRIGGEWHAGKLIGGALAELWDHTAESEWGGVRLRPGTGGGEGFGWGG